jgi:hypothetical protein
MSWDKKKSGRGHRVYYYRSRRVDGRTVKEYVGAGAVGKEAAGRQMEAASRRQQERRDWLRTWAAMEAAGDVQREFWEASGMLVKAALILAGYHLHARSEWRRRRYYG